MTEQVSKKRWQEIRAAYLAEYAESGDVDVQRLAETHKVNYGTLRNKISEQKWRPSAETIHQEVNAKVREKMVDKIVDRRVGTLETHLTYVEHIRNKAMKKFNDMKSEDMPVHIAARLLFSAMKTETETLNALAGVPNKPEDENDIFKRFMSSVMSPPKKDEPAEATEAAP